MGGEGQKGDCRTNAAGLGRGCWRQWPGHKGLRAHSPSPRVLAVHRLGSHPAVTRLYQLGPLHLRATCGLHGWAAPPGLYPQPWPTPSSCWLSPPTALGARGWGPDASDLQGLSFGLPRTTVAGLGSVDGSIVRRALSHERQGQGTPHTTFLWGEAATLHFPRTPTKPTLPFNPQVKFPRKMGVQRHVSDSCQSPRPAVRLMAMGQVIPQFP